MVGQRKYVKDLDISLNEYRKTHVSVLMTEPTEGDGLTLRYPSKSQLIIAPGRDFYVMGNISEAVNVPDNGVFQVTLTSN